jgi:murein DD-endopeptidase MepM/ murein hydrolase activator NlpD
LLRRALASFAVLALVVAVASGSLPRAPFARAATVSHLQQQISSGLGRISALQGQLAAKSKRIGALGGSIASLRSRLSAVQTQLDSSLARLRHTQGEYQLTKLRLAKLVADANHAEAVLSRQVVGTYEQPRPNLITVVLEANGLQSLLESLQFAARVQQQDARVLAAVRASRRAVSAQAERLGALQVREQNLASSVLGQRDQLARTQLAVVEQQSGLIQSRGATAARLAGARATVAALRQRVAQIEAQQRAQAAAQAAQRQAAQRQAAAQQTSTPPPSSPASGSAPSSPSSASGVASNGAGGSGAAGSGGTVSGGGFTFPLPTSAVSPSSTWSLDAGVDMSAPGGTPEYAVCSGTVVLHGIGGFGPWAPVLHCDSQLDGYSYVYYGHAGPANQLPVGTHVSAGQVMSEVGPGIVGISSGPHIEIGFCDSSGAPLGGGTASTMMSLLQSAYGG